MGDEIHIIITMVVPRTGRASTANSVINFRGLDINLFGSIRIAKRTIPNIQKDTRASSTGDMENISLLEVPSVGDAVPFPRRSIYQSGS